MSTKWKIRKGDEVVVIAGKEKGKQGKIIAVDRKKDRVIVERLNLVTKHVKRSEGRPGEIQKREASIHVSNVMLLDPGIEESGKGLRSRCTRVSLKRLDDGSKVRVAKKSGEQIGKE